MIPRPWPGPATCAAAPTNDATRVRLADWMSLDRLSAAFRFPSPADLAQLHLVVQQAKRAGER